MGDRVGFRSSSTGHRKPKSARGPVGSRRQALDGNRLFQALKRGARAEDENGEPTRAGKEQATSQRGNRGGEPARSGGNEMLRRMGLLDKRQLKTAGRTPGHPSVSQNPLARALDVQLQLPAGANGKKVRSTLRKQDGWRNSLSLRDRLGDHHYPNAAAAAAAAISFTVQTRTSKPRKLNAALGNSNEFFRQKENKHQNRDASSNRNVESISFKNASLLPFLRLENLESDVSESDIRIVLTQRFGPTLKIMTMDSVYNQEPSVTAEIFFLQNDNLNAYANALNNIQADGRKLRAEVAYKSWIINSDRLWDGVLREVAMIKQQVIKQQNVEAVK